MKPIRNTSVDKHENSKSHYCNQKQFRLGSGKHLLRKSSHHSTWNHGQVLYKRHPKDLAAETSFGKSLAAYILTTEHILHDAN